MNAPVWTDACAVEDLPPGARRVVDVDDVRVLVCNVEGAFYAIEDVCTHDYAPLDAAKIDGDKIICPRHGARFCLRTGRALTPPAFEAVPTFPVRVESGRVQVRDARWD